MLVVTTSYETSYEDTHPESTLPSQACKCSIVDICPLELEAVLVEQLLEGEPRSNWWLRARSLVSETFPLKAVLSTIKILTFSGKCTSCHNSKADPQTPDNTAEQGDNFVAEERWERNDKEDDNRDQPASWEISNRFGPGAKFLRVEAD